MLTHDPIAPRAQSSAARYRPICQIGRGGMAEVMLTMMDAGCGTRRLVVLKRIWPELAAEADFMTMFMDEARLSVRLNHPNVVRTFEVLADAGEVAIAMEYLDGQPLTRVLNRLRGSAELSVPLRLRIVASVLAGLEHAHTLTDLDGRSLAVVHRDVSPHNVFVSYDGQVKLVDFGVAKTLAASHHTRPGALKGKLAYMAPEQLQAGPMDHRADLFAVGIMLWELLAGKRMWQGMNEIQIVSQLAAGLPLPPLPSDAGLPPGLDAICERALHPNPDFRYQTAAEMELDLERVSVGAADSHARHLGRVVSLAFTEERAARRAIVDQAVRGGDDDAPEATVEPLAPGMTDAPSAPEGLAAPVTPVLPATVPSGASGASGTRRVALRRTLVLAAMVAAGVFLVRVNGGVLKEARVEPPAAGPSARSAESAPVVSPTTAVSGEAPDLARGDDDPLARETSPRPKHHHHRAAPDEDGTLPPTIGLGGSLEDPPAPDVDRAASTDSTGR